MNNKIKNQEGQNVEKDKIDFHCADVKPEVITERNKYISDRWSELHAFYTSCADEIKKYLFYVNAGGAGAVLGFMGASDDVRGLVFVRISLCFFAIGLVFIGVLRVIATHMANSFFDNWKIDVADYYETKISFSELNKNDQTRTQSEVWLYLLGYLSGISFIIGMVFGGISLFKPI